MNDKPKPLTSWYGGKSRLAPIIASKLPQHRIYLEPFGGMAGVLMAKEPSELEVYNDLSDGLVNLFQVVRNSETCQELIKLLHLTPYARAEWKYCYKGWVNESNPIEKARMFYVMLDQSFAGTPTNGSWCFAGLNGDKKPSEVFFNGIENIPLVMRRLRTVQIENHDAMILLKRWDSEETCIYLDPPYVASTRAGGTGQYQHEMTDQQHIELLDFCLQSKSKIVISGYQSEIYQEKLENNGWYREDYDTLATSTLYTLGNGLKGRPASLAKRVESLWFNYTPKTKKIIPNKTIQASFSEMVG